MIFGIFFDKQELANNIIVDILTALALKILLIFLYLPCLQLFHLFFLKIRNITLKMLPIPPPKTYANEKPNCLEYIFIMDKYIQIKDIANVTLPWKVK